MKSRYLLFFLALGVSFVVGIFLERWHLDADGPSCQVKEIREFGDFKFINRLLTCEVSQEDKSSKSKDLQLKIDSIIKKDLAVGLAEKVSAYFFSPNDTRWIGVNEDEKFSPASLLKVPIMLTYLKLVQRSPNIFTEKFVYQDDNDYNKVSNFKPAASIIPGKSYSRRT